MSNELNLASEMVESCAARLGKGEREEAVKGIRAICQYYGGQMIFLPKFKRDKSKTAETLFGVLADAVGDGTAETMLDVIMSQFGGVQIYIPQEARAFRDEVAKEIYEKYDGTDESRGDICREYKITFSQIYRLRERALALKRQEKQPLLFNDL
ncbi:MAG: hypothetical protein NC041_07105 [Bacteroides sp.]|nr:hypothetical protein [Prevotella sp.]MCM1407065.1 hypothetical protein [Treponema brennaborense]MCM1470217.1 hypothetical protein [Bacteroides sp.]